MLPTVTIDLSIIGRKEYFTGKVFLFDWSKVIAYCREMKVSLDHFLTVRIGSFIESKNYRIPILLLFATQDSSFKLIVCSKRDVDFMPCLHSSSGMPGYLDYGSELVEISRSCGFLFYSGETLFRIYQFIEAPEPDKVYASDFGNGFGLTIGEISSDFYNELKQSPDLYPEYSIVPSMETERILTPQNQIIVRYAWCDFEL